MNRTGRVCSIILCMAMIVGLLPTHTMTAFAAEGRTSQVELYTIGNTYYENNGGVPKDNGHDCQQLGVWLEKGATFRVRQINTALQKDLTLRLRTNDRNTETSVTIPANGSWATVVAPADCVPFVTSVYVTNGQTPVVEFETSGTHELPVHRQGDDEQAFLQNGRHCTCPMQYRRIEDGPFNGAAVLR